MIEKDNKCDQVVEHFGREWTSFTNEERPKEDLDKEFNGYFEIFPWDKINKASEGFDAGCGNGRWAAYIAPKVGKLNCVEPSIAIDVARAKLKDFSNVSFYQTTISAMSIQDNSQDFAYCLGVLHYVPDPLMEMQACVNKLKPGAPLLVYMFYNFENRPWWFRLVWKCSDIFRKTICQLPYSVKRCITDPIALLVYWPLAQISLILEKLGFNVNNIPLSSHRKGSFYNMRNVAINRFGPSLERRFSKLEIMNMMRKCGLDNISFGKNPDVNWCAIAYKKDSSCHS